MNEVPQNVTPSAWTGRARLGMLSTRIFSCSAVAWTAWMLFFPQGYSNGRFPASVHVLTFGGGLVIWTLGMLLGTGIAFREERTLEPADGTARCNILKAPGYLVFTLGAAFCSFVWWLVYSLTATGF